MNKLMTNRGETLVETLISIIIAVISIAFLVTSVTVASKINAKVKESVGKGMPFTYADKPEGTGIVNIGNTDIAESGIKVDIYNSNGYYYYSKDRE